MTKTTFGTFGAENCEKAKSTSSLEAEHCGVCDEEAPGDESITTTMVAQSQKSSFLFLGLLLWIVLLNIANTAYASSTATPPVWESVDIMREEETKRTLPPNSSVLDHALGDGTRQEGDISPTAFSPSAAPSEWAGSR